MIDYFETNNLFYHHQYGFRQFHGTEHPILHFCNEINKAKINNKYLLSIFIDLCKAFDTVYTDTLLSKLSNYWIKSTKLQWFRNYLVGRKQVTEVNGIRSGESQITMGVPQGSLCGPVLFLIMVNYFHSFLNMRSYLFEFGVN